jgi:hypothetical protein
MRKVFILLMLIGTASCNEKENDIPKLTDPDPVVTEIKIPGYGYLNQIKVTYDGEMIIAIARTGDSVRFFYENGLLSSAVRYSQVNAGLNDTATGTFERDASNRIISANFRSEVFPNNNYQFGYEYNLGRLAALRSCRYSSGDTIIYDPENKISEIQTRSLIRDTGTEQQFGFMIRNKSVLSYNDRPNPYYQISKRLGFPFFSSVMGNAAGSGEDYYPECIVDYQIEDDQYGKRTGRLGYEYDSKGRVAAIYNEDSPELKATVEYK